MKQVQQNLKSGETTVIDVPMPKARTGTLLIQTRRTLISAGTERMLVDFGRANYLQKARKQPDKVRMVLDKARTDGVLTTVDAVRAKLDQPLPLGYCNIGTVLEVGASVEGFAVGDRVISNGNHAEVVCVPQNLCAKVPEGVSDEHAAFVVLASIGLQGLRLVEPTLGETVVVTGLGLIGLVTVQMLRANGCRVLGIDMDPSRVELARRFGAEGVDLAAGEDPLSAAERFTSGRGVDAVLITAATKSNEPVRQAAQMCRKRGRIVLVGVTGLELDRSLFFDKELTFQVSCSYGPGRYDPLYEDKGQDYPLGFVRWTEQRNFEAVLDLLAEERLELDPLITHRFGIAEATRAYDVVAGDDPSLGILLEYPDAPIDVEGAREVRLSRAGSSGSLAPAAQASGGGLGRPPRIGVIGAGNFTSVVLVPALSKTRALLGTIASAGGFSAATLGQRFGFQKASTDADQLIADPELDAVVITTRHDSHAELVCRALEAGKHVFVEKPLALNDAELDRVEATYQQLVDAGRAPVLMVGFNRRFSPHAIKAKALLSTVSQPKALVMTVNAGNIPRNHWTQDPAVGGGRIIGEGCHFVDLLRYMVGAPITQVMTSYLRQGGELVDDIVSSTLQFADGSLGTIHYLANGHKGFPKERLDIFCGGRVLSLDNFRVLGGNGWPGFRKQRLLRQDKGHAAGAARFVEAVERGETPIPFDELIEVSRATLRLAELPGEAWRAV
jgi:predicted dehydrogenase/threonine dehydrogenase-like Zn-dependent dehydrogenase